MEPSATTNKKQFIIHTLVYGVGGVLAQLVPFILFPLYTNYLRPDEYGVLDIITQIAEFINIALMVSGIRIAALTFFRQAESEEERKRVAVTISIMLWLMVAFCIFIAVFFAGAIDSFLRIGNPSLLAFGLSVALLNTLIGVPMALTQARLESLRFVITNLTMLISRLLLCIYFVVGLEMGIWGVLWSQGIIAVIFGILLTWRELRIGSFKPDLSKIREVFDFCWPFLPGGILYFAYSNTDRYFILNYGPYATETATLAALGLYALARRLQGFVKTICVTPLSQVWAVTMYDIWKRPDAAVIFGNFAFRMALVNTFGVFGVCLFAPEIIMVLSDPSYHQAIPIVLPVFIQPLFVVMNTFMEHIFYVSRKTRYKPLINLMTLPVICLLMYICVPRWGVTGAAYALLIAIIVTMLLNYCFTQRFFYVRYPYTRFVMLYFITGVCYFGGTLFGNGILPYELAEEMSKWDRIPLLIEHLALVPWLWKTAFVVLWMTVVWQSRILIQDDKEMVRNFLVKIKKKVFRNAS